MGRRLLAAYSPIVDDPEFRTKVDMLVECNAPVAYAVVFSHRGIEETDALVAYGYTRLAGIVSAAMRLMSLGHQQGQSLLTTAAGRLPAAAQQIIREEANPLSEPGLRGNGGRSLLERRTRAGSERDPHALARQRDRLLVGAPPGQDLGADAPPQRLREDVVVRREIMHRPVTNQRFRDVFRWTREAGIMLTANFMLGLPGETRESIQQTIDFSKELPLDLAIFHIAAPYPGTELFEMARQNGWFVKKDKTDLVEDDG